MTLGVLRAAEAVVATADAIDKAREAVKFAIDSHDRAGENLRQAIKDAQIPGKGQ